MVIGQTSAGHSATADGGRAARIIAGEITAARAFLGEDGEGATALLPILHALQAEFGFIDPGHTDLIASALNISRAEVRGVVSFYHDFRTVPGGRRTLRVCVAEACQAMGCGRVVEHLENAHGLKPGGTLPDGSLSLEKVYCLGNCALGPAALLDDRLLGRVDEALTDALVRGGKA